MFKAYGSERAFEYSLAILAFAIPLSYTFTSIAILLVLVAGVVHPSFRSCLQKLKTRKVLWLWIAFFLLHVISYTYSIDKNESSFDIQRKLSLIFFPVIIGAGAPITRKNLQQIFIAFIAGVCVLAFYSFCRATIIYLNTGKTDHFFYHPLVEEFSANAVYCSLYTLFAITLLLFFPFTIRLTKIVRATLSIALIIFLVLLSSRTLIILFFAFVLPYFILFSMIRKKNGRWQAALLLAMCTCIAVVILKTNNPIKKRYTDVFNGAIQAEWTKDYKNTETKDFNNLSLRLFLWNVAMDNVKEHNLWWKGAGNGSVIFLQNEKMKQYGVKNIYDEKNRSPLYNVNVHNMFFQTLEELGLPGLILLICILFSFITTLRGSDTKEITTVFYLTMAALMMQESSLETQAGIVFFSFFAMTLYNHYYSSKALTASTV
jgi:O-antigen ligase